MEVRDCGVVIRGPGSRRSRDITPTAMPPSALAVPTSRAYAACMARRQHQYTIRQVPPSVDHALRQRARRLGRSLNQIALEALTREAGVEGRPERYTDLDGFFGSWVRDAAVDRALAEQRRVDDALWK